jgi:hypothetical protein
MAECLLHPPSRELSYFSPAELNPWRSPICSITYLIKTV